MKKQSSKAKRRQLSEIKESIRKYQRLNKRTPSPELTQEEEQELSHKVDRFLNKSLFNSDILSNDSEDFSPTREERAIRFIISEFENHIRYYN